MARSPYLDTCIAPRMVRSMWPLRGGGGGGRKREKRRGEVGESKGRDDKCKKSGHVL